MANITKTPAKTYKAIIRRRGPTVMKTFRTKGDVKHWARQVEDQMVRGAYIDRVGAERLSLEQALERYPLPPRARRGQTVATHISGKR